MKIVLLDINKEMCEAWEDRFLGLNNIEIVNSEFNVYVNKLIKEHKQFTIVSPANSFGMMDGGYDLAITNFYNTLNIDIISEVQKVLKEKWFGEQPVNTSEFINLNKEGIPNLIHTPTMRYPMDIRNTNNAYMSMKSTLICAKQNKVEVLIIPAFGGGYGIVNYNKIAHQMRLGYDRVILEKQIDLSDWNKIKQEIMLQG